MFAQSSKHSDQAKQPAWPLTSALCEEMNKITKNQTFVIIAAMYVTSWLVPIGVNFNHGNTLMGYDGAKAAQEILSEGIMYFINILSGEFVFTYEDFFKYLFKIVGGLPNILFIAAFVLATLNNKYSLHFIAPCILIMLLWGGGEFILGGYTLWFYQVAGFY